MSQINNQLNALSTLKTPSGEVKYYSLKTIEKDHGADFSRLPVSIRILLENVIRNYDGVVVKDKHVKALATSDRDSNVRG